MSSLTSHPSLRIRVISSVLTYSISQNDLHIVVAVGTKAIGDRIPYAFKNVLHFVASVQTWQ
ncbi:MAG: hypothetical protein KME25_02555 [Symplocastrum torsivum CPER-KK1]|uniref:Uncharacterized protein n=1 Tax=Symplocastrum torsivum CPER-KK1 TaxID=450513 RepID=A0A951PGZ4_9CYAN|nr:hypothetical protein [Symplocastrum torsivum CPER-KK1]